MKKVPVCPQYTQFLSGLLALLIVGVSACSGDDGPLSQVQAQATAESFLSDFLNVIGGHEPLETLLRYYPPDCAEQFSPGDIERARDSLAVARIQLPALREIDIDEIQLVDVRFEDMESGYRVFASDVRLVVEGQERDQKSYYRDIGLPAVSEEESGGGFISDGLVVLKIDGKVYVDPENCVADPFQRI